MIIETFDGKRFDIPEENVESFYQEYNSNAAAQGAPLVQGQDGNWYINDLDSAPRSSSGELLVSVGGDGTQPLGGQKPASGLGNYVGGLARNALGQGLMMGFGDEIEAGVRSLLGDKPYREYLEQARKSTQEFAADHPTTALAAQLIGGAIVPGLGTAKLAKTIGSTALTGGNLARTLGTGAASGLASGAVYGYGSGQGGVGDRLSSAATTGLVGGALGGAFPVVASGTKGLAQKAGTLFRGISKEGDVSKAEKYILNKILGADPRRNLGETVEAKQQMAILKEAQRQGAEDIAQATEGLSGVYEIAHPKDSVAKVKGKYSGETAGGHTIKDIEKALEHPRVAEENMALAEHMAQQPMTEINQGFKKVGELSKKYDSLNSVLENPKYSKLDPDSAKFWQTFERDVREKAGVKSKAYNAISNAREELFPGTTEINEAINDAIKEQAAKTATGVKMMRSGFVPEQTSQVGSGLLGTTQQKTLIPWWGRGQARTMIKTGSRDVMTPLTTSQFSHPLGAIESLSNYLLASPAK